jgi:hypothetical protein
MPLFTSAAKTTPKMSASETLQKIGNGVVLAETALNVLPLAQAKLVKTPPAKDSWPWIDLLFGGNVSAAPGDQQRQRMLALELTQMAQRSKAVDQAIASPESEAQAISPAAINRYLEAALDAGNPSRVLRDLLERRLGRPAAAQPAAAAKTRPKRIERKPHRPSATETQVCASMRSIRQSRRSWTRCRFMKRRSAFPGDDTTETPLKPGPVGEYLEIIDVDPASRRVYAPIDLNNKELLGQDGLPPSEGNPQFHQQMVYAVAMTTIGHFERALGRRALWAPHYGPNRKRLRSAAPAHLSTRATRKERLLQPRQGRAVVRLLPGQQQQRKRDHAGLDGVFVPVLRHHRA